MVKRHLFLYLKSFEVCKKRHQENYQENYFHNILKGEKQLCSHKPVSENLGNTSYGHIIFLSPLQLMNWLGSFPIVKKKPAINICLKVWARISSSSCGYISMSEVGVLCGNYLIFWRTADHFQKINWQFTFQTVMLRSCNLFPYSPQHYLWYVLLATPLYYSMEYTALWVWFAFSLLINDV